MVRRERGLQVCNGWVGMPLTIPVLRFENGDPSWYTEYEHTVILHELCRYDNGHRQAMDTTNMEKGAWDLNIVYCAILAKYVI